MNLIDKYLGEAAPKPAKLNFGDEIDQNRKAREGTGKAKIDSSTYDWAFKKFGKGNDVSVTKKDIAMKNQKMEIHKSQRFTVTTTTITPFGDYIMVRKGTGAGKDDKKFFKV